MIYISIKLMVLENFKDINKQLYLKKFLYVIIVISCITVLILGEIKLYKKDVMKNLLPKHTFNKK